MQNFINNNRGVLSKIIRKALNNENYPIDDEEIESWIMNDEGLYNWAISENVNI